MSFLKKATSPFHLGPDTLTDHTAMKGLSHLAAGFTLASPANLLGEM